MDRPAVIENDEHGNTNAPGFEWAVFRMGSTSMISHIEVDTNHFKGNYPDTVKIEGTTYNFNDDEAVAIPDTEWTLIVDKQKLQPHKQHIFKKEMKLNGPYNCIRVTMAPDGGISRVRVFCNNY